MTPALMDLFSQYAATLVPLLLGYLLKHYLGSAAAPTVPSSGGPSPPALTPVIVTPATPAAADDWLSRHPLIRSLVSSVSTIATHTGAPVSVPSTAPGDLGALLSAALKSPITVQMNGTTFTLSQQGLAIATKPTTTPAPAAPAPAIPAAAPSAV